MHTSIEIMVEPVNWVPKASQVGALCSAVTILKYFLVFHFNFFQGLNSVPAPFYMNELRTFLSLPQEGDIP